MTPEHERMKRWAGDWRGDSRTIIEPGKPDERAAWKGRMEPIVGGRFVQFSYAGEVFGKPHEGQLLIAFEKGRAAAAHKHCVVDQHRRAN